MGGWGRAPRFPQPMTIEYLMMEATRGGDKEMNQQALEAVKHVLHRMARGGMYDVVGGGFHRYSTDDAWLVPHFEKMLYDNAQLALVYLHAYLLTNDIFFRHICTETLDFILREMNDPKGGFYSSLDADTEGEEGKYYVWTPEEINQALADTSERTLFYNLYPVTEQGNFEGKNILQQQEDSSQLANTVNLMEDALIEKLDAIHSKLLAAREKRVRPGTDDKVLVAWNALALRAFAEAGRYLKREDYLDAARKNADFLLEEMYSSERLLRAWRAGQARHNAYLEDYAALILALLSLYESDPNQRWYQAALKLTEDMNTNFRDKAVGFFDTRHDHPELFTRPKDIQDNATPSGNSLAANALLKISTYDERGDWRAQAEGMLGSVQELLVQHPTAFAFWLQGFDFAVGPVHQVAVVGGVENRQVQAFLDYIWHTYRPRMVAAISNGAPESSAPALLKERGQIQGKPTVYVCKEFTCHFPVNELEGLKQQLS